MTETHTDVQLEGNRGRYEIRGRMPISWVWKIQPWWWLYNTNEPQPPDWYKPAANYIWRFLTWYIRNPLVNFKSYVMGVEDRNYDVYGLHPASCTDWNDLGRTGWKWSVIHVGWMRLPYISYSGSKVLWHIGWEPFGNFAVKFNLLGHGESPI